MVVEVGRSALTPERVTLSNGIPLLHNRAASNPSVVLRVLITSGASREAASDQGLAGLTGRMLRQGTRSITKAALAEELDGMGAGLSVDVGYALTAVSIKCLAEDFGRAAELLAEVLLRPTFPAAELDRLRGQVLTELREMDDNTRVRCERTWREMAYPAEHRYHRPTSGTPESVTRFQSSDMADFHTRCYSAGQAFAVVVGDVSQDEAHSTTERLLGGWQGQPLAPVEETLPATGRSPARRGEVMLEGKTQADLAIGLPTLSRKHPDYYALAFANHILGRMYFMGRFGEKVRDEQGLAYYAYSELSAGLGSGPWVMRAGVNPANLERALQSTRSELDRFLQDGPTETEREDAVASLLGSLPRQLETNEGVAAALSEIELYDLGLDYLTRYPDLVRAVTRESATEAARRWLLPDQMVTSIAGPGRGEGARTTSAEAES